MASCPVCGAVVAEKAVRCSNCHTSLVWHNGQPSLAWQGKAAATIWKVIITLVVIAIVVMVAIMILR